MNGNAHALPAEIVNAKLISIIGTAAVFFGVFLSGFVINEPAPYELLMAGLIGVAFICGLKIPASIAPLLMLLMLFVIGGMIAMTQMADIRDTPLYLAVSFFLSLTAVFFAAVLVARPDLFRVIFLAWTLAAMVTGLLGMLGYFGLTGGASRSTTGLPGPSRTPTSSAPIWCCRPPICSIG